MEHLTEINTWIKNHVELVSVFAVPCLTFFVTYMVNRGSEKRAEKERQVERDLARQLKLADFRQAWINDLRDSLAEYGAATMAPKGDSDHWERASRLAIKVTLLMNPNDKNFEDLKSAMSHAFGTAGRDAFDQRIPIEKSFVSVSQRVLKTEWDRLNKDLEDIERLRAQSRDQSVSRSKSIAA